MAYVVVIKCLSLTGLRQQERVLKKGRTVGQQTAGISFFLEWVKRDKKLMFYFS